MQKSYGKWIDFLFGPLLTVIGWVYRINSTNRARLAAIKSNHKIAVFFKLVTVLVLLAWLLVWFFASPESRDRLVDEVRQTIGIFDPDSNSSEPESDQGLE